MELKLWIEAFRLRTLPLALSNAVLGSLLALADGHFSWPVMVFAILTILCLQILSNIANDYGDGMHGTDSDERLGPRRFTQAGMVSKSQMRKVIALFAALSLASGLLLVYFGLRGQNISILVLFILAGILAIWAAIKYTVGRKPYGYAGLGDLFVFLFFGIAGVCGTNYLHTNTFDPMILLPASTIGFLSTGVLNLNNMRDMENDRNSGKMTIAVRLGSRGAKIYHCLLLGAALLAAVIYVVSNFGDWTDLVFLILLGLILPDARTIWTNTDPRELNPQLKKLAFTTFLFSIIFGFGLII